MLALNSNDRFSNEAFGELGDSCNYSIWIFQILAVKHTHRPLLYGLVPGWFNGVNMSSTNT